MIEIEILFGKMTFFLFFDIKSTTQHCLKSESPQQTKAFPYVSVIIALFPIFVALNILDHVETAVVTPSLRFKTNGPAQKQIWTGTRASFLRRQ